MEERTATNTVNEQAVQPKATAMQTVANLISVIFHPVFMPLAMALVIYKLAPAGFAGMQPKQVVLLFASIGISTLFFPLFAIGLMKPLGFIGSFRMPAARDRIIPLLATMIFYFWISHVFNNLPAMPLALRVLLRGNFWGIILVFLANIFTKVSMHTAAAGGMIGILIVLLMTSPANMILPLFVGLIVAGIIGSARLALGAHQRGDVWLGYIIGIIAQLGAYVYVSS
ncbi:hypothetical protein GCM10023093_29650 [Nemorincola caseinilytica]|uniref:PAP2 superfamily protein n=1 Tax=Nemorincola caseinilytica TaxID=2054315 RepID=A0ABP8NR75_9BACT